MNSALVFGLGITGSSLARALVGRGVEVTVADDGARDVEARAAELGVHAISAPTAISEIAGFDVVFPAPAVPETHPVVSAARDSGVAVWSELELAYRWEQQRPNGPRPILAITGTDGKTTTTAMTVAMLVANGHAAAPLGNTDTPLIDAVAAPDGGGLDVLVVECSSFRLAWVERFRADAAAWLNLAPDHLNWHCDLGSYERAKAHIFDRQTGTDVAIGFVDDPIVMNHLADAPGATRTFGLRAADYHVADGELCGPNGAIAPTKAMARALPHDLTNALAASALVLETGLATPTAIETALATFEGPRHRLERLGVHDGVTWYNDSKATTPHAAATALRAFDSIVLIAGGSRKGVDLAPMSEAGRRRVHTVVAIGDAADDVATAFEGHAALHRAESLRAAVAVASRLATDGDVVLLSPGCASFDQFENYEHRGDEFSRLVTEEVFA